MTVCNYIRSPGAGGKFVAMRGTDDDDSGVIVFSDFTQDFQHRDIARRWLATREDSLAAMHLRMDGGGWWKFEDDAHLVIYGQSAAYGRFDPAWLRRHLTPGALFHEKSIDVR